MIDDFLRDLFTPDAGPASFAQRFGGSPDAFARMSGAAGPGGDDGNMLPAGASPMTGPAPDSMMPPGGVPLPLPRPRPADLGAILAGNGPMSIAPPLSSGMAPSPAAPPPPDFMDRLKGVIRNPLGDPNAPEGGAQGILGRLMGIDASREKRLRSALAGGFAGGNPAFAGGAFMKGMSGALSGSVKQQNEEAKRAAENETVFGTPIYGTDEKGNTVLGTWDKRGRFRPINTGGVKINPGIKTVDTGTGTAILDSRSGMPVGGGNGAGNPGNGSRNQTSGYIPKDVAGAAEAKKIGTERGEKRSDLGRARSAYETSLDGLNRLSTQANEVLNHPGLSRITGLAGALPNVPGFPGANAQAKLDTLKSQVGFSVLQAMRDASKTGGALGQVTEAEHRLLQNNLVELQNAQSEEQFKQALQKIVNYTDGAKDRLTRAFETDYGGLSTPNSMPASSDVGNAPMQGARQAPDGNWYVQQNGKWFRVER